MHPCAHAPMRPCAHAPMRPCTHVPRCCRWAHVAHAYMCQAMPTPTPHPCHAWAPACPLMRTCSKQTFSLGMKSPPLSRDCTPFLPTWAHLPRLPSAATPLGLWTR
eukprot:366347-Chlamydomonas_euryale.AAC.13